MGSAVPFGKLTGLITPEEPSQMLAAPAHNSVLIEIHTSNWFYRKQFFKRNLLSGILPVQVAKGYRYKSLHSLTDPFGTALSLTTLPTSMQGRNVALWFSTLYWWALGGLHTQREDWEHSDFALQSCVLREGGIRGLEIMVEPIPTNLLHFWGLSRADNAPQECSIQK